MFNTEKLVLLPKSFAGIAAAGGEAGRRLAAVFHWSGIRLSTGIERSREPGKQGFVSEWALGSFALRFLKSHGKGTRYFRTAGFLRISVAVGKSITLLFVLYLLF